MRLFIGVPLPQGLRNKIIELQSELRRVAPKLTYSPSDNLHVTVKFLGEVPEARLGLVKEALSNLTDISPFMITLAGLGVFPSEKFISVIWAGVENGKERFIELMRAAEEKLLEVRQEEKSPHPHVTFVRVNLPDYNGHILDFIHRHEETLGSLEVNRLVLYHSTRTPTGVRYKELFEVVLQ